jgi:hypothetical protein
MIESLESRRLFAATLATVTSDVTKLDSDIVALRAAEKTFVADVQNTVPAGMAGRGKYITDNQQASTDAKSAKVTLSADLAVVLADKGNPSGKAAARAKLSTDATAALATLETDVKAIKAIIARDLALAQLTKVSVQPQSGVVSSSYQSVKADLAQLIAGA